MFIDTSVFLALFAWEERHVSGCEHGTPSGVRNLYRRFIYKHVTPPE
jgi:predicted nucleic acid-binding protein